MRRIILLAMAVAAGSWAQTTINGVAGQAVNIDFTGVAVLPPTTTGTIRIVRLTTDNTLWRGDGLTWSQVAVLSVLTDGAAVGSRAALNFVPGAGLLTSISDTGTQIEVEMAIDTAQVQTPSVDQAGSDLLCASASASGTTYTCALSPTLGEYTLGMVLHWEPDLGAAGGGATLNVDTLGAVPVKLADGATNPGPGDIQGGRMYTVWYDGANFRLSGGAGGSTRTWNYNFQGANYGGVPVFSGNIPPTSAAPTAKLNPGASLAVLDFSQGTSNQYWFGAWPMPPSYPANGAISYTISSMCDPANCDSTHAANVYISLACSGATAEPDTPAFTELTAPIAITNNASGHLTVTSGTITPGAGTPTLPACATTNVATIKLRADTTGLTAGDDFQLIQVALFVQGAM